MPALACREDIAWTLQTLSPNALELSRLWHDSGYISARLLDVASRELRDRLPVKVPGGLACSALLLLWKACSCVLVHLVVLSLQLCVDCACHAVALDALCVHDGMLICI